MVLLRARRTVVVVDAGEPRNAPAAQMHGFLSRDGMSPRDLPAAGRSEVAGYGGVLIDDTVVGVERPRLPGATRRRPAAECPPVLVATGLRDELPDVPGVRERWGRDLLHCPYCHGYEVRDQPLGVLGGGPDTVQHAFLVRQWSADVTLFAHTADVTRGAARAADGARHQRRRRHVARLVVDNDRLHGVELADGTVVPRSAVFVRPGLRPQLRPAHRPRLRGRRERLGGRTTPPAAPPSPASGSRATRPIRAHRSSPPRARARQRRSPSTLTWSTRTCGEPSPITAPSQAPSAPARPMKPPTKHQLALMIWLAVFPTLTLLNLVLSGPLDGAHGSAHRRPRHDRGAHRHLRPDAAAAPSAGPAHRTRLTARIASVTRNAHAVDAGHGGSSPDTVGTRRR